MIQEKERLLRELLERYSRLYMKLAYNCGVPQDDVENVVFEAYWCFYQSRYFGTLNKEETEVMMAYIVRNKCRDYHRERGNAETLSIDECGEEMRMASHVPIYDPLNEI